MPWQRREDERGAGRGRDPFEANAFGLAEEHVTRSVRTVERAVENFAALQENCDYYKGLAVELRRAFDDEKEHARSATQQLADAERAAKTDRDRAARAEDRLEQSTQTVRELERQLATVRAQTDRLVQTISRLMSAESRARGGKEISVADLLAA